MKEQFGAFFVLAEIRLYERIFLLIGSGLVMVDQRELWVYSRTIPTDRLRIGFGYSRITRIP